MTIMKVKIDDSTEVEDIPGMREMSIEGYESYIKYELFFFDHHEVFRSNVGQYPIATTPDQVDVLIAYLKECKARMIAAAT